MKTLHSVNRSQAKLLLEAAIHNDGVIHHEHILNEDVASLVRRKYAFVCQHNVPGTQIISVYVKLTPMGMAFVASMASQRQYTALLEEVKKSVEARNS